MCAVDITTKLRNPKQTDSHAMSDPRDDALAGNTGVNNVLIYLMISSTALDRDIACRREAVTSRGIDGENLYTRETDDKVIALPGSIETTLLFRTNVCVYVCVWDRLDRPSYSVPPLISSPVITPLPGAHAVFSRSSSLRSVKRAGPST